jgi:lanosterol synthase
MSRKSSELASQALNGHTTSAKKRLVDLIDDEEAPKHIELPSRTDYTRWRLLDERGRHTWHYLEDDEDVKDWPQSIADKYFLGLPTV